MRLRVFLMSLVVWLIVLATCAFVLFGGDGSFGYALIEPGHVPVAR